MENLAELMRLADFVLMSRAELRAITECDEPDAGARLLLERGVPSVVATLGEQGAACFSRRPEHVADIAWAPSFNVDVVDTTGAGDAFASGFISSLVEGRPTAECLRRGNACAAMAIGRVGAREALPTSEELEMFLAARGGAGLPEKDGAEV
jgi:sugar/nucleoside kinase (ribokinase family)